MIVDYHIHTKNSYDARGDMQEYIANAKQKNINEIGFSEHMIFHNVEDFPCMSLKRMNAYVEDFLRIKKETNMSIRLGVEVDFAPNDVAKIRHFIRQYPFDYVIGSVHLIGDWAIDNPSRIREYSRRNISQVYQEYFGLVQEMCKCGLFDVLAHPDLIKIFGFKSDEDIFQMLRETAETMAKSDICAEINTRGLRRPCKEIYPSKQFLKMLCDCGVPITFGSDAHESSEVGYGFKEAVALAKKVGYSYVCTFDLRQKKFCEI